MKGQRKIWRLILAVAFILLLCLIYLLFTSPNTLDLSAKLLCAIVGLVGLIEIRLLQGEAPIFKKLGWMMGIIILALLIPQFIAPQFILLLWNFTLAAIALLSGLLMFAMVGKSKVAQAFVVFLTLCITLLMILEFASPLVHKIALGVFVTAVLICIHVMTTARQR
jgi:hypothetical protein